MLKLVTIKKPAIQCLATDRISVLLCVFVCVCSYLRYQYDIWLLFSSTQAAKFGLLNAVACKTFEPTPISLCFASKETDCCNSLKWSWAIVFYTLLFTHILFQFLYQTIFTGLFLFVCLFICLSHLPLTYYSFKHKKSLNKGWTGVVSAHNKQLSKEPIFKLYLQALCY